MFNSENWNIVFICLIPVLLVFITLYIWIFMEKIKGKQFPFKDILYRSAGESLKTEIDKLSDDFDQKLLVVIIVPIVSYAAFLQINIYGPEKDIFSIILFLSVLVIGALIYTLIKLFKIFKKLRTYRLGYAGEVAVGQALNNLMLSGYRVFHDIPGDKSFNIDHVVVGRNGVFALETKAKRKSKKIQGKTNHYVNYDGQTLKFDGEEVKNTSFIEQTKRNAKWLKNYIEKKAGVIVFVQPVLIIPGWFVNRLVKNNPVIVLGLNEVTNLLNINKNKMLTDTEITQITSALEKLCKDVDLAPEAIK